MTQTISDDLEGLRAAMTGSVFAPDDGDYDEARSLFNGEIDRRPAVIARCSGRTTSPSRWPSAGSAGWRSRCAAAGTARRARRPRTAR